MKATLPFLLLCSALAANGQQEPKKPVYRDAATHEQIVKIYQRASMEKPMDSLVATEGPDPSVVNQPENIVDSSDIITFGGLTTLVPKRAIMQTPPAFQGRINNHVAGTRVVTWKDFYVQNRGWITTVELSREQAEGKVAIAEEVAEQLSKSGNLIVATYQAGPISLLPPKKPANPETETAATITQP